MTGSAYLTTTSSLDSSQAVSSCTSISTIQSVEYSTACEYELFESLPGRKVAELGSNSTLVTVGVLAWNKTTGPPGREFLELQ